MATETGFPLNTLAVVVRQVLRRPMSCAATVAACMPAMVYAGPNGEQVVAGQAIVNRPDANTTQIQQGTDQVILNWQSFSIGGQEYVQFTQPGSFSVALNRVVGGTPSEILGHLSANGRVFLVNPRGVLFGPGSQVDVNGLVASVLDIRDEDFLAGRYVFARSPGGAGGARVVNQGTINAQDGGFVVLAGDSAANEGLIRARLGTVALAAGSKVTLDVSDSGLVNFAVDEAALSQAAGAHNVGRIIADGGRVLMTAKVAEGLVTTAVNNEGLLRAHSIEEKNGAIYLRAAGGGIENHGTLDVAGEAGKGGGNVVVKGDHDVTLTAGSRINADGDGAGNGGAVRVIADGSLHFRKDALISAHGGPDGGKGGLVELSGHAGLAIRGELALGKGGRVLIDPSVLDLVAGSGSPTGGSSTSATVGVGYVANQLNLGVNVTLVASNSVTKAAGPLSINATTGNAALAMKIGRVSFRLGSGSLGSITSGGCSLHGVCQPGTAFSFSPGSSGNIRLSSLDIHVRGNVDIHAGSTHGSISVGKVASQNSHVILQAGNTVGRVNAGDISAANFTRVDAHDDINAGNIRQTGGAAVSVHSANGNITVSGIITNDLLNGNTSAGGHGGGAGIVLNAQGNIHVTNGIQTGRIAAVEGGSPSFTGPLGVGIDVQAHSGAITIGDGIKVVGALNSHGVIEAIGMSHGRSVDVGIRLQAGNGVTIGPGGINVSGVIDAFTARKAGVKLETTSGDISVNGDIALGKISASTLGKSASVGLEAGNGKVTVGGISVANIRVTKINNSSGQFGVGVSVEAGSGKVTVNGDIKVGTSGGGISVGSVNASGTPPPGGDRSGAGALLRAGDGIVMNGRDLSVGPIHIGPVNVKSQIIGVKLDAGSMGSEAVSVGKITVGDIDVNGNAGNVGVDLNGPGSVTVGAITAGKIKGSGSAMSDDVGIHVRGQGAISVGGNISANTISGSHAGDVGVRLQSVNSSVSVTGLSGITVGKVVASVMDSNGHAGVRIKAGTDISLTGGISVSNITVTNTPPVPNVDATVNLTAGLAGAGNITVGNTISVNTIAVTGSVAHAGVFLDPLATGVGSVDTKAITVGGITGTVTSVEGIDISAGRVQTGALSVTGGGGAVIDVHGNGGVTVNGAVALAGGQEVKLTANSGTIHVTGSIMESGAGPGNFKADITGFGGNINLDGVTLVHGNVDVSAGSESGDIAVGNVTADASSARIKLTANGGNVSLGGADAEGVGFASVDINAAGANGKVTATGAINAYTGHVGGNAFVSVNAGNGITAQSVKAEADHTAHIVFTNANGGTIQVNGSVTVTGHGTTSFDGALASFMNNSGGPVNITGVDVTQKGRGDARISIRGGSANITGNLTATATDSGGRDARIDIDAFSTDVTAGNFTARGRNDGNIDVFAARHIFAGDLFAEGFNGRGSVHLFAGPETIHVRSVTASGDFSARVSMQMSGSGSGDISVDGDVKATANSSAGVRIQNFGGGGVTANNVQADGAKGFIRLTATGGDIRINSARLNIGTVESFSESFSKDITIHAGGVVQVDNGLVVRMGSDPTGGIIDVSGNAILIRSPGGLHLNSVSVANGTIPGVGGSDLLLTALQDHAIPVIRSSPNLKLVANGPLSIAHLDLKNAAGYIWLQAHGDVQLGNVVNEPADVLVQTLPFSPEGTIGFDNDGLNNCGSACAVNVAYNGNFSNFSGTTFAFGSVDQTGGIFAGPLDLNAENLVFITAGGVNNVTGLGAGLFQTAQVEVITSLGAISTTGTVLVIDPVFSLNTVTPGDVLETTSKKKEGQYGEGEGGGGEGGNAIVEQDTGSDKMCQ